MKWGQAHTGPRVPRLISPSPATPCRCLGKRRELGKNPGAFKGGGVGESTLCTQPAWPLLGIYELPGEAWNVSQRGQAKRALEGRSVHPKPAKGAPVGQSQRLGPSSSQPVAKQESRFLPQGAWEEKGARGEGERIGEAGPWGRGKGVWSLLVLWL